MPTVGRSSCLEVENYNYGTKTESLAPRQKDTRTIVREEIQRQKQLDKLEEKYNAGEISKFEYTVQKAMINGFQMLDTRDIVKFSTTA